VNEDAVRAAITNLGMTWSERKLRLPFRYQLVRVLNEALRAIAAEAGAPFVDRWDAHVVRGLAPPGLLHDWMHIGSRAADETALVLTELFFPASAPRSRQAAGTAASDEDVALGDLQDHGVVDVHDVVPAVTDLVVPVR
jgi:hypothetical protein